jgi:nucleoside 2-deoxyribosyltransferase
MKVYLAGPYVARDTLRTYAGELATMGWDIQCRWLDETVDITPGVLGAATDLDDGIVASHARADIEDIKRSDVLVGFTSASVTDGTGGLSGGRHVEFGVALALGKTVLLVGEPENVFHRLPQVTVAPDWHAVTVQLAALLISTERKTSKAMTA